MEKFIDDNGNTWLWSLLQETDMGLFVNTFALWNMLGHKPGDSIGLELVFADGRTLRTILLEGKFFKMPKGYEDTKIAKVAFLR